MGPATSNADPATAGPSASDANGFLRNCKSGTAFFKAPRRRRVRRAQRAAVLCVILANVTAPKNVMHVAACDLLLAQEVRVDPDLDAVQTYRSQVKRDSRFADAQVNAALRTEQGGLSGGWVFLALGTSSSGSCPTLLIMCSCMTVLLIVLSFVHTMGYFQTAPFLSRRTSLRERILKVATVHCSQPLLNVFATTESPSSWEGISRTSLRRFAIRGGPTPSGPQ